MTEGQVRLTVEAFDDRAVDDTTLKQSVRQTHAGAKTQAKTRPATKGETRPKHGSGDRSAGKRSKREPAEGKQSHAPEAVSRSKPGRKDPKPKPVERGGRRQQPVALGEAEEQKTTGGWPGERFIQQHETLSVKKLSKSKTKWVDDLFPANVNSLASGAKRKTWAHYTWSRPEDYFDGAAFSLFSEGIHPTDVDKGRLGDHYLMVSLSAMAEFELMVQSLFHQQKTNPGGVYSLDFYVEGV